MKIAMVTGSVSRRAGGMFHSVRELSRNLGDDGVQVQVFGSEDPDSHEDLAAWHPTPVHVFPVAGPVSFGYQRHMVQTLEGAHAQLLHLHGLWQFGSCVSLRWSRSDRPCVISPRGMLDPWAVRNARIKKVLAGALYERHNLKNATCLHALAEGELKAIRAYGLRGPVALIPNGIDPRIGDGPHDLPPWHGAIPSGARILLFLGRIHPKKGLSMLIDALSLVRTPESRDWHVVVAGWDDGGHEDALRRRAADAGLGQCLHFVGPQLGKQKLASLAAADAFVLPSLGEGLPMAVLEAWAFRIPALLTEACNLPEGDRNGAAIEVGVSAAALARGLEDLFRMGETERRSMGQRGRQLVEESFSWSGIASSMKQTYAWALGSGPRPSFVDVV